MNLKFRIAGWIGLFVLGAGVQLSDAGEIFAFKFETNQPLVYEIETRTSTTTSMISDLRNVDTTTVIDLRYKVRLTEAGQSNDVTTVNYKPYDIEGDWDIRNASGHFVSSMHDLQVRGTQNGIVLFDTERKIGMAQAKKFKNEMVTLFLSGQMDIDSAGEPKTFYGDLPFIDFWTEIMKQQIGFFGIVFPNQSLRTGDHWAKSVPVTEVGAVKFDNEGIILTNTYTRDTNSIVDGRELATFDLDAPFDDQDLTGYLEQPGQNISVDVSEFSRDGNGVFHFDQKRGLLVDSSVTADGKIVMTSLFQGKSSTANTTTRLEMQIKLLPSP